MSDQSYASPNDPYWLSSRGVNSVSFTKQSAPPLAYLDKGILYELDDGVLYFNGFPLSGASGTVAEALGTTGADVVIGTSAPPVAGQTLIATSATTAEWQDIPASGGPPFADDVFAINDVFDPTAQFNVNVDSEPNTLGTLRIPITADRTWTLPDHDANLVGGPASASLDQVPAFSSSTLLKNSNVYLKSDQADGIFYFTEINNVPATFLQSAIIGNTNMRGGITSVTGSSIIGTGNCDLLNSVGSSVVIGNDQIYQGGLGQDLSGSVLIGSGFGQSGAYLSSFGNVAIGFNCCTTISSANHLTAIGTNALEDITTGSDNIAIGYQAGSNLTTGSGNVYIGNLGGLSNEALTIRIGTNQTRNFQSGIRGITTANANAIPVLIDSAGQLGTISSSLKYKENVKDLDHSAIIHKLRPVTFNYIGQEKMSIGLIAEEVEKVYPDMCIYQPDAQGGRELLTVDYCRLSTLLLAEVQELKSRLDKLTAFAHV